MVANEEKLTMCDRKRCKQTGEPVASRPHRVSAKVSDKLHGAYEKTDKSHSLRQFTDDTIEKGLAS